MPLRVGLVAGESSGDLLGARVLDALARRCPGLKAEGVGGAQMQARGLDGLYPMERLSVMGLTEPLLRLNVEASSAALRDAKRAGLVALLGTPE